MSEPMNPPGNPPNPPAGSPPPPPAGGGPTSSPPPPPSTGGPGAGGTESPNRGLMLVLSYLWILALIPLLVEKEDREVQWHAKHGLVLLGAEIVIGVLLGIFSVAIDMFGCLGCASVALSSLYSLAVLVLHVFLIFKAVNGERFLIPGISQYADRF